MRLEGLRDHRRFPVARRASRVARESLQGTAGEALIAAVCALVAAFASAWSTLLAALGGAAGGLLLVRGSAFVLALVRYRLSGWTDGEWEARMTYGRGRDAVRFELVCIVQPPVELASFGRMECLIIDPDGREGRVVDERLLAEDCPVKVTAMFNANGCYGDYEVHWYASTRTRGLYEITRATFQVEGKAV